MLKACLMWFGHLRCCGTMWMLNFGSYESVIRPAIHSTHCPGDVDVTAVTLEGGGGGGRIM